MPYPFSDETSRGLQELASGGVLGTVQNTVGNALTAGTAGALGGPNTPTDLVPYSPPAPKKSDGELLDDARAQLRARFGIAEPQPGGSGLPPAWMYTAGVSRGDRALGEYQDTQEGLGQAQEATDEAQLQVVGQKAAEAGTIVDTAFAKATAYDEELAKAKDTKAAEIERARRVQQEALEMSGTSLTPTEYRALKTQTTSTDPEERASAEKELAAAEETSGSAGTTIMTILAAILALKKPGSAAGPILSGFANQMLQNKKDQMRLNEDRLKNRNNELRYLTEELGSLSAAESAFTANTYKKADMELEALERQYLVPEKRIELANMRLLTQQKAAEKELETKMAVAKMAEAGYSARAAMMVKLHKETGDRLTSDQAMARIERESWAPTRQQSTEEANDSGDLAGQANAVLSGLDRMEQLMELYGSKSMTNDERTELISELSVLSVSMGFDWFKSKGGGAYDTGAARIMKLTFPEYNKWNNFVPQEFAGWLLEKFDYPKIKALRNNTESTVKGQITPKGAAYSYTIWKDFNRQQGMSTPPTAPVRTSASGRW